jgi:SAM-dependent methyltransferase
LRAWGDASSWVDRGDEWSETWGSAEAQWFGCVYPRIRRYLPARSILELAPGHGRWTQFLLEQCEGLIGVDISESAVEVCRSRFADNAKAEFFTNDGRSLDVVPDGSIDFAFSFDSLVHVEADVLGDYLVELAKKLTANGVAWLHHSNLGTLRRQFAVFERVPPPFRRPLITRGVIDQRHLRATTVTADGFADACAAAGLRCVGQELVNWGGRRLIDCISIVTLPGAAFDSPRQVVRNPNFMAEAESVRLAATVHNPAAR